MQTKGIKAICEAHSFPNKQLKSCKAQWLPVAITLHLSSFITFLVQGNDLCLLRRIKCYLHIFDWDCWKIVLTSRVKKTWSKCILFEFTNASFRWVNAVFDYWIAVESDKRWKGVLQKHVDLIFYNPEKNP